MLRRLKLVEQLRDNPKAQAIEIERCRRDPLHFFDNWMWTYDPRVLAAEKPAYMPFDLFPRQRDLVRWLEARLKESEEGLVEKSRDIGWTWVAGGFALHHWLFVPGFKTTFGSRKEQYVDLLGDPDSIFEKIRLALYRLPIWMLPVGYSRSEHDNFMRLINPDSGNVISGEAGDNMGRGGRSSLYIVDEGAHIERAERVESAIIANSDCRIWASSVNGIGNLFYRKRHNGTLTERQIFVFDWRDDPRKTAEWAKKKENTLDPVIWASEYNRDYAASMEGVCILGKWVQSAIALGKLASTPKIGKGVGGLDVGDGKAFNVFIARFGPLVQPPVAWKNPDTTDTAHRGIAEAEAAGVEQLNFDNIGVGKGVSSTLSKAGDAEMRAAENPPKPPLKFAIAGINVGLPPSKVLWPDGKTAEEMFTNTKAELWWTMRDRFKATHSHMLFLTGVEGGERQPLDELIALPESPQLASELSTPKWFKTEKGKIIIEAKDKLAARGVASPDFAEALALTFVQSRVIDLTGIKMDAVELTRSSPWRGVTDYQGGGDDGEAGYDDDDLRGSSRWR